MELRIADERAAQAIQHSGESHEVIATKLGTSRARITRITAVMRMQPSYFH